VSRKASFVIFAGLALVVANAWRDTARANGWASVLSNWKAPLIGAGAIVAGGYIANMSDRAADVVLLVLAILWLLFALHTWGGLASSPAAPVSGSRAASAPSGSAVPNQGASNVRRIA
jgi:uncharacterized membrane protein